MTRKILFGTALLSAVLAAPAAAQHVSLEPFATYGFYGKLPGTNARLEGDWGVGGRAALHLTPRWAAFGTAQRTTPQVLGQLPFGVVVSGGDVTVDHWSAGLEYSYFPRDAAEGMLPLSLSAGVGQARYEDGPTDLALNLGISGALQLGPSLALRYGLTDYVSRFDGDRGWTNQLFARIGAELSF